MEFGLVEISSSRATWHVREEAGGGNVIVAMEDGCALAASLALLIVFVMPTPFGPTKCVADVMGWYTPTCVICLPWCILQLPHVYAQVKR